MVRREGPPHTSEATPAHPGLQLSSAWSKEQAGVAAVLEKAYPGQGQWLCACMYAQVCLDMTMDVLV